MKINYYDNIITDINYFLMIKLSKKNNYYNKQ